MMERSYIDLFDLEVHHSFYASGLANDFSFIPLSDTSKDASNFNLIMREAQGEEDTAAFGLRVMYPKVNGTVHIPISATTFPSLKYGMVLRNQKLRQFTVETDALGGDEIFIFTNVGAAVSGGVLPLVRSTLKLNRKVFNYQYKWTGALPKTVTFKVLDEAGTAIPEAQQILLSDDGNFEVLVDLNRFNKPDGKYTIVADEGSVTPPQSDFYLSDELLQMKAFGLVDLKAIDNTSLAVNPLRIEFTPKLLTLKYFVVFRKALLGTDAIVVGKTGFTFSEVNNFLPPSRKEDKATKESLEARHTGGTVKLYEADNTIPYSDIVVSGIELKKNLQPLIKNLPTPSLDNAKAEAYIII